MKVFQVNIIKFIILLIITIATLINLQAQAPKHGLEFAFTPTGGYRFFAPNPSYFDSIEKPLFSHGVSLEYKRYFNKILSLGVGFEYQNLRYGSVGPNIDIDSLGNPINMGTVAITWNHYYLGVPIRFYLNMVNTDKFKLYGFIGINTLLTLDMGTTGELKDPNGQLLYRNYSSIFSNTYPYASPMRIGVEVQAGLGFNYNFSKKLYVHANTMFALNGVPAIIGSYTSEFVYRFGGSTGLGYRF